MRSISEIREEVHSLLTRDPMQSLLFSKYGNWASACAALDIIDDIEYAFSSFRESPYPTDTGLLYVQLFGILGMIYVQQDAALHLAKILKLKLKVIGKTKELRELRNDAVGHPAQRIDFKTKDKISSTYINRNSLNGSKFQITINRYADSSHTHTDHDLSEIISQHTTEMGDMLERVLSKLKDILKQHRNEFQMVKLERMLSQSTHSLECVWRAIHYVDHKPIGVSALNQLIESLELFEAGLKARYNLRALEAMQYKFDYIRHAIERLKGYFQQSDSTFLLNNSDAAIFHGYLQAAFSELHMLAKSIDDEYSHNTV
jgi:ElaB/YqjD/DUF883 family membrane-anchored ribosome-binding protein